MIRFLLIMVAAAGLLSCRSTKKIQTAIAKKDTTTSVQATPAPNDSSRFVKAVFQAIDSNRIDYTTFSAKVNVDYRDAEDKRYDFNTLVRIHKDSAVWMSVNAILGIEALRVLITRDSVMLLDKQNKIYTARSIDFLQELTSLPLTLKTVQDLIIGNPVFLDSNVVSLMQGNNTISLLSLGPWFKNLLTISQSDSTLLRSKLDDADLSRSRTADLTYSDYEKKSGNLFSTKRRINVVEKKKLDINLEFKQYAFNEEVSFPFSIPKNYRQR